MRWGHSTPFINDTDHIIQEHPVQLQPHGERIVAFLLEMALDLSPHMAVPGGGGDVGSAGQASKEPADIFEGVIQTPKQGLEVVFDGDLSGLQSRIGNGFGQLS